MGRQILAGEVIELPEEGVFFRTPKDGGPHEMLGGGLRTDAIWWALQQIQEELKPMKLKGMEQAYHDALEKKMPKFLKDILEYGIKGHARLLFNF